MHKKDQGKLGESAVISQSLQNGCEVFVDFGDNSKVDLILNTAQGLVKVQVKCYTPTKGCVEVYFTKSGPNYRFRYEESQIDYFAVVNAEDITQIAWLKASDVLAQYSRSCALRLEPTKNNQSTGVVWFKDYQQFPFGPLAQ